MTFKQSDRLRPIAARACVAIWLPCMVDECEACLSVVSQPVAKTRLYTQPSRRARASTGRVAGGAQTAVQSQRQWRFGVRIRLPLNA